MRTFTFALAAAWLVASAALAHGPQIQITRDDDQITTRRLLREEPYSTRLTAPTSVYVVPLVETEGVWYSRPNDTPSATLPGLPEYISGPGIAFGYDQVDGGTRVFAAGQHFKLNLIDGLKWWNGSAFIDPGLEEVEAFRSSGTPAVTNDALNPGSPAILAYGNISPTYNSGAHSGASFRMLGDGSSATVEGDDGIYLLSMTYGSSEPGLDDSAPFYFVLHKNSLPADILAAVNNLNVESSFVQFVPEPSTVTLVIGAAGCIVHRPNNHRRRRRL
jgi:hypothetical protein